MNVVNKGVDYISTYAQDLKKDITALTGLGGKKEEANTCARVKSLALRVFGGVVFASSAIALTLGAFAVVNLALVTAVGWATISVAAVAFGHDLVKIGENIRKQFALGVHGQQATGVNPKATILEGTWICQPVFDQIQNLKDQLKLA